MKGGKKEWIVHETITSESGDGAKIRSVGETLQIMKQL